MLRQSGITAICVMVFLGCAPHLTSFAVPGNQISNYRTAYVERINPDVYGVHTVVVSQLASMGFVVVEKQPPDSLEEPAIRATYTAEEGWDLGKYMKSFQITFTDAASGQVLASASIHADGNWRSAEKNIALAFQQLRQKLDR